MSGNTSARLRTFACASAISITVALAAGAANAQCTGPDANQVVNCPAGTYSGINYPASSPGITINIAADVTVTTEGVGARGSGDITINGDPSDTFTSTDPNQAALYGVTTDGNVTLIAGDVSAPNTTAIIARTDSGDVSINVQNVSAGGGQGIVVGGLSSGAPGNVSITTGDVSALDVGIGVGAATGVVTINAGNVSSAAQIGILLNSGQLCSCGAGAPTDVSITANSVSGYQGGVFVFGATGNVSVAVVGAASSATGAGILVSAEDEFAPTNVTVTAGSVSGDGAFAVGVGGATGNVSIAVAGSVSSANGTGIAVSGSGADAPQNVSVTAGSVSGGNAGVDITGATGDVSVAVAGNVSAAGAAGVDVLSNGADAPTNVTVTTGNVSANGDGIDVIGATGTATVTVNGNVSSPNATGIALATGGSSKVTVQSGASVSGVTGIDATVGTAGVQGGLNVIDDGTITGTGGTAIRFNPGANSLTLGTGWAINGAIVGGTDNALILAGSINSQTASQDAPSFTDFSSLEVKTGFWTLLNPASYPTTTVDAGAAFEIDTTLTSNLTDFGELLFSSPGVTANIIGKLTFAKGSIYAAEVTAGGATDLIAVTGPVTIQSGANFVAVPTGNANSYANNTQYVVITATGGVSGTFSNVVSAAPLLSATLIYPHDEVRLILKRNNMSFASQAVTPNQAAAAAAIEAGGTDSSLYMALVGQTALGLQKGYGELDGESYADFASVMLEQSDETRRSLVNRMNAPNPTQGLWVATYGDTSTADDGANFQHARTALGGSASGVDFTLGGWRAGLATSVGYDSLSLTSGGASTVDSYWTASAYTAYDSGPVDVRFGATYGWHRLASNREVAFPGYADANRSLSHVSSGEAFGEIGWTWKTERGFIEPFAGVALDTVGGFALTESGGASALDVATAARTLVTERVGVQGETALFGDLTLHGAIAWRHASGDLSGVAHATFQSTGESFTVHGLPIAANAAEITAGLSGKLDKRTTLDLSYHGEAGDHFSDNALKLAAAWRF